MNSLLFILERLFTYLDSFLKKQEQKKVQEEVDDLEANPANWFDSHFDGLPTMPNEGDASKTNSTDK